MTRPQRLRLIAMLMLAPSLAACGAPGALGAQVAVASRGATATEPHAAPGFTALRLPRGWARHTDWEEGEDSRIGRTPTRGPRTTVFLGGPHDAVLHFGLGAHRDVMGQRSSGTMHLYARLPGAPAWTMGERANGLGDLDGPPLRLWRTVAGIDLYLIAHDEGRWEAGYLVLVDPAKGLRLAIEVAPTLYSADQAIAMGVSILQSAQPDGAALAAARGTYQPPPWAVR